MLIFIWTNTFGMNREYRVPKWWRHKNIFFDIMVYDAIFL